MELQQSELDGVYIGMPFPVPGFFGFIIGQIDRDGQTLYAVMDDSDPDIPDNQRRIKFMDRESVETWRMES